MAYEFNRLARGLAREEIRAAGKNPGALSSLFKMFHDLGTVSFKLGKRLKPNEVLLAQSAARSFIEREFYSFGPRDERIVLIDHKVSDVHGAFYWLPSQKENFGLSNQVLSSEPDYIETTMDLRYHRFSVDRRRIIYDNSYCNLSVSEHCLFRLLDREAVVSEPLKRISDMHMDLMALCFIMQHGHMLTDGNNRTVLIPFGDGLFVGRVVFMMDTVHGDHSDKNAFRYQINQRGYRITKTHTNRYLTHETSQGATGELGLQLITYIDRSIMETNQLWVHNQLTSFISRHRNDLDWIALCLCSPESITSHQSFVSRDDGIVGFSKRIMDELRDEMVKLMMHSRWRSACNAPQVVR